MSNETIPPTSNITLTTQIEKAPTFVTAVMLLIGAWIVVINSLLIVCLLTNKLSKKDTVSLQILTLSVSDILVGLSVFPVTLTYLIMGSFPYYGTCAAIFTFYLVGQTASLFHLFGICIRRVLALGRGQSRPVMGGQYRDAILYVLIPWAVAICFILMVLQLYGASDIELHSCSTNTLFGHNYRNAVVFLNVIWLSTQLGMTMAYIYLCVRIHKLSRGPRSQIHSTKSKTTDIKAASSEREVPPLSKATDNTAVAMKMFATNTSLSEPGPVNKCTERSGTPCMEITSCVTVEALCRVDNMIEQTQTHSRPRARLWNIIFKRSRRYVESIEVVKQNKISADTMSNGSTTATSIFQETCASSGSLKGDAHQRKHVETNHKGPAAIARSGRRWQKHALVTIGMLLVTMNLFLTPLNCLMLIENIHGIALSRKTKFLLAAVSLLNSALNPFIYAARIPPLRQSVNERLCCSRLGNSVA